MDTQNIKPGKELLNRVRGAFIARGTTLTGWCEAKGLLMQNARAYLLGERNGRIARMWRQRLIEEVLGEKQ